MIILRAILYLICTLCIVWSATLLVGPMVLKSIISTYSNNQLSAANITVTPKLDIKIDRLDYTPLDNSLQFSGEGFSRSVNISWSIFENKPFLELDIGPTFVTNIFAADHLKVSTLPFSKINFQSIKFEAKGKNLKIESNFVLPEVLLSGVFQTYDASISNVSANVPSVSQQPEGSWALDQVYVELNKVDLFMPIDEQSISAEILIAEVIDQGYGTTISNLNGILTFFRNEIDFELDGQGSIMLKKGWLRGKFDAEGIYNSEGLVKTANLEFSDISSKDLEFDQSKVTIDFLQSGIGTFDLKAKGELNPFELSLSGNYIGSWPESNFEIGISSNNESEINTTSSAVMKYLDTPDILANGESNIRFVGSNDILSCFTTSCEIIEVSAYYKLASGDEWLKGESKCASKPCKRSSFAHKLQTSDTASILAIVNKSQILSPIYALYFYGIMSSGTQVGSGHEIKINY